MLGNSNGPGVGLANITPAMMTKSGKSRIGISSKALYVYFTVCPPSNGRKLIENYRQIYGTCVSMLLGLDVPDIPPILRGYFMALKGSRFSTNSYATIVSVSPQTSETYR